MICRQHAGNTIYKKIAPLDYSGAIASNEI